MINVTLVLRSGHSYLLKKYVSKKVKIWSNEILSLSSITETHPHIAYCAFVYGVIPKWNYVMQTIKSMGSLFQPLEK